eukprot:gene25089-38647_t
MRARAAAPAAAAVWARHQGWNLSSVAARYGDAMSDLSLVGYARDETGRFVPPGQGWKGLVRERLRDTLGDVFRGPAAGFGGLRSTVFLRPNVFTDALPASFLPRAAAAALPIRLPLSQTSVWARALPAPSAYNPVAWHAHPDAGAYLVLVGERTFRLAPPVHAYGEGWVWDPALPLPPWCMHAVDYDTAGEHLSARQGWVFAATVADHPRLWWRGASLRSQFFCVDPRTNANARDAQGNQLAGCVAGSAGQPGGKTLQKCEAECVYYTDTIWGCVGSACNAVLPRDQGSLSSAPTV